MLTAVPHQHADRAGRHLRLGVVERLEQYRLGLLAVNPDEAHDRRLPDLGVGVAHVRVDHARRTVVADFADRLEQVLGRALAEASTLEDLVDGRQRALAELHDRHRGADAHVLAVRLFEDLHQRLDRRGAHRDEQAADDRADVGRLLHDGLHQQLEDLLVVDPRERQVHRLVAASEAALLLAMPQQHVDDFLGFDVPADADEVGEDRDDVRQVLQVGVAVFQGLEERQESVGVDQEGRRPAVHPDLLLHFAGQ